MLFRSLIQDRINSMVSNGVSYEDAIQHIRSGDTVDQQSVSPGSPLGDVMDTITPQGTTETIIEHQKMNTDEITSRLDTLLSATNDLNESVRGVEIAFPNEMKLGGDTVEFAEWTMRKAFDAAVRGS